MLTFVYYLLKVIVCSGILYGYYLLLLRNKIFNRWNRFYLLTSVVLSLAVPLIKINIFQNSDAPATQVIHLIQVVNTSDEFVYEYTRNNNGFNINAANLSILCYIFISGLLLALLIQTLIRINKLKHTHMQTIVEGINFINTDAEGTPFSFFATIFWNNKIDLNTPAGKQIFQHELAHVKEKHSYDKVFMNLLMIFFWCNPVFWLIRKELNMIHEFIADNKAIGDNDASAFAAMILQATYPQHQFNLTNNFFYSPLKRRLLMLTKDHNPKMSYISRLLVLPLAAVLFVAFTLKAKVYHSANLYNGKKLTVIIDAGHGGEDKGAAVNGINEKDITLSLALKIKEVNTNENINIILTRNADDAINVKDRVAFAKSVNADVFISLHLDADLENSIHSGLSAIIPGNENAYLHQSKILGSDIIESFKNNYQLPIDDDLKQREKGVWILNSNVCPAVLIETGFLTNNQDKKYLIKADNQKVIARNILNGIEKYAMRSYFTSSQYKILNSDTLPEKKNMGGFYADVKNKIIFYADTIIHVGKPENTFADATKAILIMNGEKINNSVLTDKAIKCKILTIYSGTDQNGMNKYSGQAKNGVFVFEGGMIIDKPDFIKHFVPKNNADTDNDKVFTKAEVYPSLPGGESAWNLYIKKIIEQNINELRADNKSGTCLVRFIVAKDGTVSQIQAMSMQGTKLAEVSVEAIRRFPKWIPGRQNGHTVNAYKEVPITFAENNSGTLNNNNNTSSTDKVYTKTQVEPTFPGGDYSWRKYITKIIGTHIDELLDEGKAGTCRVRFFVDVDGTITDIVVLSMQGTKLAGFVVDAIKKGPKWIPGQLNGQSVVAYKEQPVTFTFHDQPTKADTTITVKGFQRGRVQLNEIANAIKLDVNRSDFIIESFTVYFAGAGFPYVKSHSQSNADFSQEIIEELKNIKPGSSITFDKVKIRTPDGKIIDTSRPPYYIIY